jgi:micrococcal nuclease
VVGISDGDTIKVMHNGKAEKIRLHGIDCPEKAQPFGTKAKQFTSEMVFGKTVTVHVTDTDRYGRTVADVIVPDGRVLNRELVAAGLAWWYWQYSKDASLGKLETEARAARRGLWADPNPVPPWCYRKK